MLSLDVRLGWVIRVPPDLLGAHLEAFVKLKPTLDTLHLCNRFGGPDAAITKLPSELIDQIGAALLEPIRKQARNKWTTRFKCFSDQCKPVDHYTNKERLRAWSVINEDPKVARYEFLKYDILPEVRKKPLSSAELKKLNDDLRKGDCKWYGIWSEFDEDEVVDGYGHKHNARAQSWYEIAGKPGSEARGIFSEHKEFLEKTFGLEFVVGHAQVEKKSTKGPELCNTTTAYLLLGAGPPSRTKSYKLYPDEDPEEGYDEEDDAVEGMQCFSMSTPPQPSPQSLRRFDRALTLLGLEGVEIKDSIELCTASQESSDEVNAGEDSARCKPTLKLLTLSGDKGRYY